MQGLLRVDLLWVDQRKNFGSKRSVEMRKLLARVPSSSIDRAYVALYKHHIASCNMFADLQALHVPAMRYGGTGRCLSCMVNASCGHPSYAYAHAPRTRMRAQMHRGN